MVIIVPGSASYPHLSFHNSLNLAHGWSRASARWSRKWEKNCCQKSTMGSAFWGNKSFPAGIYRADNRPQGHMTTEVGGQIQLPIHTRLLTGKTDPQICFATNSSRKLFVKPDSFRKKKKKKKKTEKNEFIKDDPKQKSLREPWLKRCQNTAEKKYASCRPRKSAQGHNYNISHHRALIHLICLCQSEDVVHLLKPLWAGVCASAWVEIITQEQDRLCPGHQWCRSRINKPQWQRLSTQLAPEPRDRGKVNKQWIFISRPVCPVDV